MAFNTPTVAQFMAERVPECLHCAFENAVLMSLPVDYMGKKATPDIQMFTGDLDKILKEVAHEAGIVYSMTGC